MDNKEIIQIINSLEFNKDVFEDIDVELNDLERKRIRNYYKKNIYSKKHMIKKSAAAAGLIIAVSGICIAGTPVNASKIPVLNSIYEDLGIYSEYKDYNCYIGESIKAGKYEYTIDSMVVTPYKCLVGVKISSSEIIKEDHPGFYGELEIGDVRYNGSAAQTYRINGNTIFTAIEYYFEEKIPRKSAVKINIHSLDDEENDTYGTLEFKADFDKSYDEFTSVKVKAKAFEENKTKIREINSSVMGTNIVSDIRVNRNDGLSENLQFMIEADGRYYGGHNSYHYGTSFMGILVNEDTGISTTYINTLRNDEFEKSKNINLIVCKAEKIEEKSLNYISYNNSDDEGNTANKDNVQYKKNYKFADGSIGSIYEMEKANGIIKFKYKGKECDIIQILQNAYLYTKEENNQRVYYPVVYKGEEAGEFIIEFENAGDEERKLFMSEFSNADDRFEVVREIKVK